MATVHDGDFIVNGELQAQTMILPASCVNEAAIINGEVSAPKLEGNLQKGCIQLPLHDAREIASNAYPDAASNGGLLASDSTPLIEQVNGAVDPQTRIKWAAGNVDPIKWQVVSPPDFDPGTNLTLKLMAKSAGGTDTPTFTLTFYEGVGGSNLGGATGALSSSLATVSRNVAATADPPGAGTYKVWSIQIVPGAHGTDAVELYGAWLEYQRSGS